MGHVKTCLAVPERPDQETVYRFPANRPDETYYRDRTDRNVGWITQDEQMSLRGMTVAIAGCGGMGGQLAEKLLRLGIGNIRIADNEVFEASNINRQFAASRSTIGKSKAFETARLLRAVTDDAELTVYPQGVCEETVSEFLAGADVVCDEIEFWAAGSRILLHAEARARGIPVFNCNTVGFGTHLFLFTPEGVTMEKCLGLRYEGAIDLQRRIQLRTASQAEVLWLMDHVIRGLFPVWPEYCTEGATIQNRTFLRERLFREGKGSILATNPPFATGFLADRILLRLLWNSSVTRSVMAVPEAPGYLYLDAAKMEAKVVVRKAVSHE